MEGRLGAFRGRPVDREGAGDHPTTGPHATERGLIMSRSYRIAIREHLRRVLKATDRVSTQLEILEVLPTARMAGLLAEELERRGFRAEDGNLAREQAEI